MAGDLGPYALMQMNLCLSGDGPLLWQGGVSGGGRGGGRITDGPFAVT
jgi:hypothetical protein